MMEKRLRRKMQSLQLVCPSYFLPTLFGFNVSFASTSVIGNNYTVFSTKIQKKAFLIVLLVTACAPTTTKPSASPTQKE